jgi:hypothetical protein
VRLGVLPASDRTVVNSLRVVDKQLSYSTPHGTYWHRASFDGYGETATGGPWVLGSDPDTFVNEASTTWPTGRQLPHKRSSRPLPPPRTVATCSPSRYGTTARPVVRADSRRARRPTRPPRSPGRMRSSSGSRRTSRQAGSSSSLARWHCATRTSGAIGRVNPVRGGLGRRCGCPRTARLRRRPLRAGS